MAANVEKNSDAVAGSLLQLAAVQSVLRLSGYSQEHVLHVARRMLRKRHFPTRNRSFAYEPDDNVKTAPSNAAGYPLDAASLLLAMESHYGLDSFVGFAEGVGDVAGASASPGGDHPYGGSLLGQASRPQKVGHRWSSDRRTDDAWLADDSLEEDSEAAQPPATADPSMEHGHNQQPGASSGVSSGASSLSRGAAAAATEGAGSCRRDGAGNKPAFRLTEETKFPTKPASALEALQQQSAAASLKLREKMAALRKENSKLKARQNCRRCLTRPANLTLLPCGHFCLCVECGQTFDKCPLCLKTVLADVRTFVS